MEGDKVEKFFYSNKTKISMRENKTSKTKTKTKIKTKTKSSDQRKLSNIDSSISIFTKSIYIRSISKDVFQ